MIVTHDLKTWPKPFEAIWQGRKTAELRRDDRNFKVADHLLLREWLPESGQYTGRNITAEVTHIIRSGNFEGLMPGFVVLSIHIWHQSV